MGTEADREQLQENIRLAQQLGATVETVYGDDVAYQIAEFARLSGAAKIVIGRSTQQGRLFSGRPSLIERLIYLAPALISISYRITIRRIKPLQNTWKPCMYHRYPYWI